MVTKYLNIFNNLKLKILINKNYGYQWQWKKPNVLSAISIENSKALKYLSIFCKKCCSNNERIFKEEESIKILKILSLINNEWVKVSYDFDFMLCSLLINIKKRNNKNYIIALKINMAEKIWV